MLLILFLWRTLVSVILLQKVLHMERGTLSYIPYFLCSKDKFNFAVSSEQSSAT